MYHLDGEYTCITYGRRKDSKELVIVTCLEDGYSYYVVRKDIIEFISISEDAPPFAEWERI
jgi:hypothetical protein